MFVKFLWSLTLFVVLLCTWTDRTEGKKIVSVEFFGSKSHVITYLSLLEEMARRGHEVTVVGPSKGLTKEKGIREIQTIDFAQFSLGDNLPVFQMKEENVNLNPFTLFKQLLPKYCSQLYDRPDINSLLQENFDLIILQPLFNECSLGLVHKLMIKNNASLVLFFPTSAPSFMVSLTGGYYPPSFVSSIFLGFRDDMTFKERFINMGTEIFFWGAINLYFVPAMESTYREKLGQDMPSATAIMGKSSLILSNGHYTINRPKPNLPDVVDVGGIHSREAQPLPKNLEDFIAKGGKEGFILFSLGSAIKAELMSDKKRQLFLNVFSRLKQRVIWKYESDMTNVPANVLLSKWLPQQDLLGHPKIRMFITHCGGGSTEEAIFHGTPLLGFPFYGDQPLNAKMAQNFGYLHLLDWNDLTEDYLMAGINEVLNNPKYRDNAKRMSEDFRDQIDKPLDRGVWWLEYVLRHKGAPQLRSAARDLNFLQYHSLDVLAAYLALIFITLWLLYKAIAYILSFCRKSKPQQAPVKKGKKHN